MSTVSERLEAATVQAESASAIAKQWAEGPENTTIPTESGPLPTLAEFMRRNAADITEAVSLREDLEDGTADVGAAKAADLSKATINVLNLKALASIPLAQRRAGVTYRVMEFNTGTGTGGHDLKWNPTKAWTSADIGLVWPDVALNAWNGTATDLSTLYGGFGSGVGCFERIYIAGPAKLEISPDVFGSLGAYDDQIANTRMLSAASSAGLAVVVSRPTYISSTITVPNLVDISCIGVGKFVAKAGFTALSPVLKFGDNATDTRWVGKGGDLYVDCQGQRIIGIEFSRPWERAEFRCLIVDWSAYIAIKTTSGFGLKIHSIDCKAPSIRDGFGYNADHDSIGVLWGMSDSYITGACKTTGYFVGFKATGSNNKFNGIHPYGLYEKDGIPQTCPMGIPIWNEGQGNRFTNSIADSPSKIDYDAPASLTNGGYGTVNRGNAYQSSFDGITVFVPNRTIFGETIPTGLKAHYCDQLVSFTNAEINDQTGISIDEVNPLTGPDASLCRYEGIERQQIYSRNPPNHLVKPYFRRGIEFNATYQDVDKFSSGFGSCSFSLVSRNFFQINTNYEGNISAIKLERVQSGNTAVQSFLATILGTGDSGYRFYRTDTKKLRVWNGVAFQDSDASINFFYGYNIPGLAANETKTATLTAVGALPNQIANITFDQPHPSVKIWVDAGTDQVVVYFQNITSSPVSASASGTLGINCVPLS